MPMVRHQPWIAITTAQAERIDAAFGEERGSLRDRGPDLREIEARREVLAVREEEQTTRLRLVFVLRVRLRELAEHREVEGVAFVGAVQADEENVSLAIEGQALHDDVVARGERLPRACYRARP